MSHNFTASVPGSLMLLGEYGVLEGGYALVTAVNRRLEAFLTPRTDNIIQLFSQEDLQPHFKTTIQSLNIHPTLQFVLTTLQKYQGQFKNGFDLRIQSAFSDQIGFASSAAVTVATLSVLKQWLNLPVTTEAFILEARDIVRTVQGIGSGADVAACVLGGVVEYCAEPFYAARMSYDHPLTVVYSGRKTKTVDAIAEVQKNFLHKPQDLKTLITAIKTCAEEGIAAARGQSHIQLGKIMNMQQMLMASMHLNTLELENIIRHLQENTLGAKISGSGLGDCAVGLGEFNIQNKIDCCIETLGLT